MCFVCVLKGKILTTQFLDAAGGVFANHGDRVMCQHMESVERMWTDQFHSMMTFVDDSSDPLTLLCALRKTLYRRTIPYSGQRGYILFFDNRKASRRGQRTRTNRNKTQERSRSKTSRQPDWPANQSHHSYRPIKS